MRDMHVCEQQTIVADGRDFIFAGRALNAHVFAQDGSAADTRKRSLAVILSILRGCADRRKRIDHAILADLGPAVDDDVRLQHRTGADRHIFADDAVGTDLDSPRNLRIRMNDSGRMNHYASRLGFGLGLGAPPRWGRAVCANARTDAGQTIGSPGREARWGME